MSQYTGGKKGHGSIKVLEIATYYLNGPDHHLWMPPKPKTYLSEDVFSSKTSLPLTIFRDSVETNLEISLGEKEVKNERLVC